METVLFILAVAFSGLIVGALARLALPGRDPMGLFQTMLVGVAGSLIAGLVVRYVFDSEAGPGFLLSLLFAVVIVYAVRKIRQRQLGGDPPAT